MTTRSRSKRRRQRWLQKRGARYVRDNADAYWSAVSRALCAHLERARR